MAITESKEFLEPGEIIFESNAPARHIYVLEKGEICVQYGDNPLDGVGSILEGESFGESALLIGGRRSATVRCETEVTIRSYDADQIKALFKKWKDGKLMCQCLLIEMINANEYRRTRLLKAQAGEHRAAAFQDLVNSAVRSFSKVPEIVRDPKQIHDGWERKEAFLITGGHAVIRLGKDLVEIGADTCLGASQLVLCEKPLDSVEIESIKQPLAGWFIPVSESYEKLRQLNVGLAAVVRGIAHKTLRSGRLV